MKWTADPYYPGLITRILRALPTPALATVSPADFHRWPTRQIVPCATINELISNEKSRRSK